MRLEAGSVRAVKISARPVENLKMAMARCLFLYAKILTRIP
jgi:hypothetical protein